MQKVLLVFVTQQDNQCKDWIAQKENADYHFEEAEEEFAKADEEWHQVLASDQPAKEEVRPTPHS